ncbi:MAG: GDP-L-fucose synthase, partial [Oscillospiraceae bacterium]
DIAPTSELINIGVASGISIKDMAQMIKKEVGYTGKLTFDTSKLDGDPYKTVDGTRCKEIFNWLPEIGLEEGIHTTVEWYLKNK